MHPKGCDRNHAPGRRSAYMRKSFVLKAFDPLNLAQFANQWIAIDPSADGTRGPRVDGGVVVDHDEELAELCSRLCDANLRHCTIVFATGNS